MTAPGFSMLGPIRSSIEWTAVNQNKIAAARTIYDRRQKKLAASAEPAFAAPK